MNRKLLYLSCLITGYNFKAVKTSDGYSRKKAGIYAIAIMLPTLCWAINGYLLTTQVLNGPARHGVLTALICSIIVFMIERLIVLAHGGWKIGLIRFLMAVSVSTLGSFATKMAIYHGDIENRLASLRLSHEEEERSKIEARYKDQQERLKSAIGNAEKERTIWMDSARKEAARVRPGPITRFYVTQAELAEKNKLAAQVKLDSLEACVAKELKDFQRGQALHAGVEARIEALIDITFNSAIGKFIFFMFFTFFMCIEFIVWVLKHALPPSVFENDELLVTEAGLHKYVPFHPNASFHQNHVH